jgi:hypothetical protein
MKSFLEKRNDYKEYNEATMIKVSKQLILV